MIPARRMLVRATQRRQLSAVVTAKACLTAKPTRPFVDAPRVAATASLSPARLFSSSIARLDVETVKVPSLAESISEGTLKQWIKKEGDYVEADEEVASIETDKVDISVNAPKAGVIKELLAAEEDTVTVGQDLFKIEAGAAPEGGAKKEEAPKEEQKEEKQEEKKEESAPKQQEQKEDKPAPKKEDKPAEPKKTEEPRQPKPAPQKKQESKKDSGKQQTNESKSAPALGSRTETRVKMSRMRLRIAERLKQSQNTAAFLTTFNEIDMSALMSFRSKFKDEILKRHGVKLGFMSAFVKASCLALQEFPVANASIEEDQIVYRDYVDVSVAVSTEKGLVTPVLRNAESMSFLDIEQGIVGLGKKARDNKLTLEDLAGGTFTVSNGGVFGSLYGTPIINTPQSAVLGMHAIKDKPVVVDGQIVIRPIMVVALTYDHRLLDGREAVSVLVRIKELIENPAMFALSTR
ncbi:hypothetical protein OIO90_002171 [Microbotryomycetes sp. JL221]|nr:hypothetical protein OIO90_002171 [Microbotryomycetes sp. JL221]